MMMPETEAEMIVRIADARMAKLEASVRAIIQELTAARIAELEAERDAKRLTESGQGR